MIDHVLGRPSIQFRKAQVLAVVAFWSLYSYKGDRHGPPVIRKLSSYLSRRLTPWQVVLITILYLYVARNLSPLLGLESPEPLANLYSRSYFRATWVTTALDAGFWTAMRIKRRWLRDICSIVFSIYYLFAAEQADEKVRKVRGTLTLDHLRISWNKSTTPYLGFLTALLRPRLMKYPPRAIRIPRPRNSDYREPVRGWLYFNGPLAALRSHTKLVLDIPGGGFVAMDPRTNDDKLFGWASKTGLPILSLDYGKAPEHPYPYALNECFDVYRTIVASRGRCIGLSGEVLPRIVITGDSAGGNLAAGTVLMIIESGSTSTRQHLGQVALPVPTALVLVYPGLDMNIGNWMSDEQMSLIKDRTARKLNRNITRQKSMQYTDIAGTPQQTDDEEEKVPLIPSTTALHLRDDVKANPTKANQVVNVSPDAMGQPDTLSQRTTRRGSASHQPIPLKTRLAMSSMISYFNDRILTPEMMRAMIILYIGPHNRPDFTRDYLLSPVHAPEALLAEFPKTYFLTGERDPLVDDTVIFAGRIRHAKAMKWEDDALRSTRLSKEFDDRDVVEVALIPGISHGFLQFVGIFPEGWKHINRCARWIEEAFEGSGEQETQRVAALARRQHKHHLRTESSGDEGLEISMTKTRSMDVSRPPDTGSLRHKAENFVRQQSEERDEDESREQLLGPSANQGRPKRNQSMNILGSSDDLLGRRMMGLAGPLTDMVEKPKEKI